MSERVKVMLLIPHLGGGGAERVVAQLARSLDRNRFATHLGLITQDRPGAEAMPAWVEVHRLECGRVRDCWRHLLRLVWEERPDLVFSGMAHLSFAVLLMRPFLPRQTRVILRQNTTASMSVAGRLERLLYRFLYPQADAIVCQSEAMACDLMQKFGISQDLICVLKNPVDLNRRCRGREQADGSGIWPEDAWPRLLSIGRLSEEKGFDLLLGALHRLRRAYPKIHAVVLGEGEALERLEKMRKMLGLTDAVRFAGYRGDWAEFCDGADFFVLSSRYEGMPNALLEAAAQGMPLVATPCSGGVIEILQGAPGAWMASATTVEALADAILSGVKSLGDTTQRPMRFNHAFMAPFETGQAVAAYAALFERIAGLTEADRDA